MSKRTVLILIGCAVVLVSVTTVVTATIVAAARARPVDPKPPEIGGQQAPAEARVIDFGRRYDVYCSLIESAPTAFRNCKVVGFTGPDAPAEERSDSSSHHSSSSSAHRYFDRWLVLELSDGRFAYIPPNAIKYLETAKSP